MRCKLPCDREAVFTDFYSKYSSLNWS